MFAVNGKDIDVRTIPGLPAGAVGVSVARSPNTETGSTTVTFDDFRIWTKR